MRYLPLTPGDRVEMLAKIGVAGVDDLFAEVPQAARLKGLLDLPRAQGELEVERRHGTSQAHQQACQRRHRPAAPLLGLAPATEQRICVVEALAEHQRTTPNFSFHYLTAREMYNLIRAAESGWTGSVAAARDRELIWDAATDASPLVVGRQES